VKVTIHHPIMHNGRHYERGTVEVPDELGELFIGMKSQGAQDGVASEVVEPDPAPLPPPPPSAAPATPAEKKAVAKQKAAGEKAAAKQAASEDRVQERLDRQAEDRREDAAAAKQEAADRQ
jgi:hypothetical protein